MNLKSWSECTSWSWQPSGSHTVWYNLSSNTWRN